jgi:uncharacterized membrane protein
MGKYLPDIISIIGLALLGYGLFVFQPWVAFAVVGVLLIVFGFSLGRIEVEPDRKNSKEG